MHALAAPRWNERLPGALVALAVQAGLFLLLLHSFAPVTRRPETEGETIFLLPRLAPRAPTVIDARPSPRAEPPRAAPALPVPEIPPTPPPYTQALPGNPSLLTALRGALACAPDAQGRASPLVSCRGPRPAPRNDLAALSPALPVRREAELAAERARSRSTRVPCVSMETSDLGFGQGEQHIVMLELVCTLEELRQ